MTINRLILNSAIAQGLDVIGDRWTLLILHEAFFGRTRFEEFRQYTGASRSTLTRRLNALVESDILYKRPYSASSNRFEYKFTENGLGLLGASLLALQWESDWLGEKNTSSNHQLFHTRGNHNLIPKAVCQNCKESLIFDDVSWLDMDQKLDVQLDEIRSMNTQRRVRDSSKGCLKTSSLVDLVGDRWTLLILIASFFGTSRYDDFIKQLNIAPGVLAERLKSLLANDIFEKHNYQNNPPRYEYRLTNKGKSIYPFIMALRQWVVDRLDDASTQPNLIHKKCGKKLVVEVNCSTCHEKPWPQDIRFISPSKLQVKH